MKYLLIQVSVFLVLQLAAGEAAAVDGTPSWTPSVIDDLSGSFFVSSPDLGFDHFGTPAVAWSSVELPNGTNSVRLSQLGGLGFWSTDELATGTGVGIQTAVSFDRAERATVAWVNANASVSGSFDGGPVQSVGVGAAISSPVITLSHDLEGSLRGMFAQVGAGDTSGISFDGSAFGSADLFDFSGVATLMDAAMVADGQGLRQMVARVQLSGGEQAVMAASEVPGGGPWASGALLTADTISGVDIAVDPADGNIAVAYSTFDGSSLSDLYYAKFNGFAMETTLVQSSDQLRFEDLALAFDLSDGLPAIAVERKDTSLNQDQLAFIFQDSAMTWQTSIIDTSISFDAPGGLQRRPSLAFDDFGTSFPAVAYVDDGEVLTVAFDPPVPEPSAAMLMMSVMGLLGFTRRRRL